MSYGHPIEGDPSNRILDSRYAFRVLRDTQISPGKSLLPYSSEVRDGATGAGDTANRTVKTGFCLPNLTIFP